MFILPVGVTLDRDTITGKIETGPVLPVRIEGEWNALSTGRPFVNRKGSVKLDIPRTRSGRCARVVGAFEAQAILDPISSPHREDGVGPGHGDQTPSAGGRAAEVAAAGKMITKHRLLGGDRLFHCSTLDPLAGHQVERDRTGLVLGNRADVNVPIGPRRLAQNLKDMLAASHGASLNARRAAHRRTRSTVAPGGKWRFASSPLNRTSTSIFRQRVQCRRSGPTTSSSAASGRSSSTIASRSRAQAISSMKIRRSSCLRRRDRTLR